MKLTLLECATTGDLANVKKMAAKVGLDMADAVYNSTSTGLIGFFWGGQKKGDKRGAIIKTEEMGFLFVQDKEDLGL